MSQDEINHAASLSESTTLRFYRRRMLLVGCAILALSLLAGVVLSFYQWDRGSPFEYKNWGDFNPLGRATFAPLIFAFIAFPLTLPVVFVLSIPVYFGLKKQTRWPLAVLGFVVLGILWLLWLTELWAMD